MRDLIIGVDGGGTKTNLVAVDAATGKTVAASSVDSIHVLNLGFDKALANLKLGVTALGLSPEDRVVAISIGDPAIDDTPEGALLGQPLREAAESFCAPGGICVSKSDVFMALYAFSGGEPAALLAAGTGSMGIALQKPFDPEVENEVITVGGWGDPTGDPGSAYSIAVHGIQEAMLAFDGVASNTILCKACLAFYGVDEPRKLIEVFNSGNLPRSHIAAFARQVDSCANIGDGTAQRILRGAANMLSRYAKVLLQGMENPKIGITGSVLLKNLTVRRIFEEETAKHFPNVQICVPTAPPEYGAAMLAADILKLDRRNWT